MSRAIVLVVLLTGCASPAMAPELSLHDRFVLTVLTYDDGSAIPELWRWDRPIQFYYDGPEEYRAAVYRQADELGAIAGQPVEDVRRAGAPIVVEISDRDTPSNCQASFFGGTHTFIARVHIWSELPPAQIRQCIAQEMGHILGPSGDLDGVFGSRSDTVFASYGGSPQITEEDRLVFQVLYDGRLQPGMPRDEVLAVLPQIVADVEARQ